MGCRLDRNPVRHPSGRWSEIMRARLRVVVLFVASGSVVAAADLDSLPIRYSTAKTDNAITKLERQLKAGTAELDWDDKRGYLSSLLKALDVPVSSQVLVFTKTSVQRSRIGPRTPRAIYFNDDVTVGFCQEGEVLEVAAADPNLGTFFYTLNQRPRNGGAFTRQTDIRTELDGFFRLTVD
jgi:hypothetical protein